MSCVVECYCVIESVFIQPFSSRRFTDKINIVSSGILTPLIPTLTSKTKICTNTQNYINKKLYTTFKEYSLLALLKQFA